MKDEGVNPCMSPRCLRNTPYCLITEM